MMKSDSITTRKFVKYPNNFNGVSVKGNFLNNETKGNEIFSCSDFEKNKESKQQLQPPFTILNSNSHRNAKCVSFEGLNISSGKETISSPHNINKIEMGTKNEQNTNRLISNTSTNTNTNLKVLSSFTSTSFYSTGMPTAPTKTKKTSQSILSRLSGLSLSGFHRSDTIKSDRIDNNSNNQSSRFSIIKRFSTSTSASDLEPSQQQPISIPLQLTNLNQEMDKLQQQQKQQNIVTNKEEKPINTPSESSPSESLVDIKRQINDEKSQLLSIKSKIGDLSSAKYILSISQAMTIIAKVGDEKLKNLSSEPSHSGRLVVADSGLKDETYSISGINIFSSSKQQEQLVESSNPPPPLDLLLSGGNIQNENESQVNIFTFSFYGTKQPKISIEKYVSRIVRYLNSYHEHEPSADSVGIRSILIAVIYIDRIRQYQPKFIINSMNIHRLFLAAILVANKFIEDDHPTNEFMANVGGIELKEINFLEKKFCELLSYKFFVSFREVQEIYSTYNPDYIHIPSIPIGYGL